MIINNLSKQTCLGFLSKCEGFLDLEDDDEGSAGTSPKNASFSRFGVAGVLSTWRFRIYPFVCVGACIG